MKEYPLSNRNKLKRVPKRGHYDKATLFSILDAGFVCHIGFVQNGQPFVIPTLYGRKEDEIYIHGASTSRMMKELEKEIDICMTVTHVDGLVLARSAFHHSMNYHSAIVFAKPFLVEGQEKYEALEIISENVIKDRWQEVREPSAKELKATSVLKLCIEEASCKIRTGPPGDDEADYDLPIWAGLINFETKVKNIEADLLIKSGIDVSESVRNYKIKH